MLHQNYSVTTVTSVRAFLLLVGATAFLIGFTDPIDVQRRNARQKGENLARRARSHGGFLAIDQSLYAGFRPVLHQNYSVTTVTSVRAFLPLIGATLFSNNGYYVLPVCL